MAEIAPASGGGANRTFLVIIAGLAGLLFVGLVALGALFILPALGNSSKAAMAQPTATPTRVVIPPTATRVPPTPTLVMIAQATEPPVVTATPSPVPVTATPEPVEVMQEEELPESGLGEDLLLLGGGLLMLLVIATARRARTA